MPSAFLRQRLTAPTTQLDRQEYHSKRKMKFHDPPEERLVGAWCSKRKKMVMVDNQGEVLVV
eukprot:CAMPEP_0194061208 /NCGR_PEP_ID=MMETSP0009_2-20130614/73984_1 /TAXON_ID=210454 /ORGANISM="Grammatophora oceanica, Strain CCMP 410" /LENGTH=61 /DNA_ID=CAMNT_0038712437 /DNA_START=35 /DNA_END=220 /DNA_ORIENTATION=-